MALSGVCTLTLVYFFYDKLIIRENKFQIENKSEEHVNAAKTIQMTKLAKLK